MSLALIAAVLFLVTAVLHFLTVPIFGDPKRNVPVAGYGVLYLALGVGLLFLQPTWLLITAIVITVVGLLAALAGLKSTPSPQRPFTLLLIVIDLAILGCLVPVLL